MNSSKTTFKTEDTYAFFEGKIVPFPEAKISVMNHAFNYGTAFFSGIRSNWNQKEKQLYIFRLKDHYLRLCRSSKLMLTDFHRKVSFEEFEKAILTIIQKSKVKSDIYVRPIVYKSSNFVGVKLHDLEDQWTAFLVPLGDYIPLDGINCGTSSWRRISDNAISAKGKITGSYVNSALAKTEAITNGYDEAIVLDENGYVVEGSAENIFIVRDRKLITPSRSSNILEGITRRTVIKIAQDKKIPLTERNISRTELYYADEIFLCGTGAKISPVVSIDKRKIGQGKPGPISLTLQKIYFDLVIGKKPQYKKWLTPVY